MVMAPGVVRVPLIKKIGAAECHLYHCQGLDAVFIQVPGQGYLKTILDLDNCLNRTKFYKSLFSGYIAI